MHGSTMRLATTALAGLAIAASAAASDLKLDGRVSVEKRMGGQVVVTVTGNPNSAVTLFIDVSAGPTMFLGQSLPLGFTGALGTLVAGNTDASGQLTLPLPLPASPALHELTIYLLAAVADPSAPAGLDFSNGADLTLVDRNVELAGNSLAAFPFFDYVRAINAGASVELAIDPAQLPEIAGQSADVYVVDSKTRTQWIADGSLTDVAGGPQTVAFTTTTVQANTITLDSGALAGPDASASSGDTRIGVGYDVVIDVNQNGRFDAAVDLIDGYDDAVAGFYVVRDTSAGSTPGNPAAGPLAVSEAIYTGGVFLGQVTFWPTDIANLGQLPLVVISHGNGHNYQWYSHLGYHLASYGYVVMSHENNTGPGSGTAAQSTLANTDFLLEYQHVIGGGALNGHLDTSRIIWIGHSRGGDGVARAYDDLFKGVVTPTHFSIDDIVLVDSIAPVDFGGFEGASPVLAGTSGSHPHDANFHLWVAQADADVNGCASSATLQWYHLHDRATALRSSTSLYGVGHGDYHNGNASSVASGPGLIGRSTTHLIMLGYILPLLKHYVEGDVPSRDFLWRQYESFRPIGVPIMPGLVANLLFQDDKASGKFIIDDFQDILTGGASPAVASSGAPVTRTTPSYVEGTMDDSDRFFSRNAADPFNGFTMDDDGGTGPFRSESFGSVFSVDGTGDFDITYDVSATVPRFADYEYLSFRAAQGTRHPLTEALLADLTFTVTLEDQDGVQSSIDFSAYGAGIEQPYLRPGCTAGGAPPPNVGWNSEFETIRIRIDDFLQNGSGLDLTAISKLIFNFGPSWGSSVGRIGLDEIELTAK